MTNEKRVSLWRQEFPPDVFFCREVTFDSTLKIPISAIIVDFGKSTYEGLFLLDDDIQKEQEVYDLCLVSTVWLYFYLTL